MLAMPAPTPYDLNFRVLGIPVRVHPWFWVVSLIMGYNGHAPARTLVWVACVFVSILIHELGHGLMGRLYGSRPRIALYAMGGLCSADAEGSTARRLAVILAGPGAGFLLFGLVYMVDETLTQSQPDWLDQSQAGPLVGVALRYLRYINLYWGLVNLLPVWPLDGGQALGAILDHSLRQRSRYYTHAVGLVVGALVALWFFGENDRYPGFLFAFLAFDNFQLLQAAAANPWGDDSDNDRWWRG